MRTEKSTHQSSEKSGGPFLPSPGNFDFRDVRQEQGLDDKGPKELAKREVLGSVSETIVGGQDISCSRQEVDKQSDTLREELEPSLVPRELDKDVDLPTAG